MKNLIVNLIRLINYIFSVNIGKRYLMSHDSYYQNYFKLSNPGKCVNVSLVESFKGIPNENLHKKSFGKPPFARSSFENRMFTWLDTNKNVVSWGSEVIQIKYFNKNDGKQHIYWVDVYMEMMHQDGMVRKHIIEVKPEKKTKPPKIPKNKTRKAMFNYQYALAEYNQNQSKWEEARRWASSHNMVFSVVTEEALFK